MSDVSAKTYLVTGATGFLGRHLCNVLTGKGHAVRALARSAKAGDFGDGVTAVKGDILDESALEAASEGCAGVFHCAGKVSREPNDAGELHRVHVLGTRAVLAAAKAAKVPRVVLASTSGTVAISEDSHKLTREDDKVPYALIQRFPYYRAKLFAEQEALRENSEGFAVVSVNPSLLLGPGDVFGSSTHDVRLFLDRSIPVVPAGGMAFVDARDAAEALSLAMEKGAGGRRYLVNGCNLTVRSFFEKLERISGVKAPKVPMPRSRELAKESQRVFDRVVKSLGGEPPVDAASVEMGQLFWYVDATRAERELGWRARDPMETLVDTVRELRGEA